MDDCLFVFINWNLIYQFLYLFISRVVFYLIKKKEKKDEY